MIPDFIGKLKLAARIDDGVLLNVAKKQLENGKFNDAALIIVRYKFQQHFDIASLMMKLVDLNKIETAKMLIEGNKDLQSQLIRSLSTNDNCKKAA